MLTLTVDMSVAKRRLSEVRAVLRGDGSRARPAYEAAGLSMLADVRTAFVQKARGETDATGEKWQDISPITKLLRRGPKVSSWAELESEKVEIGRDTNGLYQSLTHGSPGNLFELKDTSVTIGTNLSQAARFHAGGQSPTAFIVTQEMYQRARKRVAKPRKLNKQQRRSIRKLGTSFKSVNQAKRVGGLDAFRAVDTQKELRKFNREIFGALFGMQARGVRPMQPARNITPDPESRTPKEWIERATAKWWSTLKRIIGRANG